MPLLNYQLFILFRKYLRFRQFADSEPIRLAQFALTFDIEYSFANAVPNVDVNQAMLVTVKPEFVSVLLKDLRH
jgi:hypothetical protein